MATFIPSRALMPSCWLLPESGPWKPILMVPSAGLPVPAPLPHLAAAAPPPPPLLLLLLQAVSASGSTITPTASDASRRVVDPCTWFSSGSLGGPCCPHPTGH